MFINPLSPFTFLKISSLKATSFILFVLLLKSNLLRLKGGLIGGLFALILISGLVLSGCHPGRHGHRLGITRTDPSLGDVALASPGCSSVYHFHSGTTDTSQVGIS